jgi:CRISPR-associated protein (Cas_Cmr3)
VIRLRSPGVLVDDLGRPSRDPNPAELAGLFGSPARVERHWARWQSIGGWHVASRLPKPTELAVAAGSTYGVATERPLEEAALVELSRRGLGLRRHEGFGDLGGAPVLAPGKVAKDAEKRRLRRLVDDVAALRGSSHPQGRVAAAVGGSDRARPAVTPRAAGYLRGRGRAGLDARACAVVSRALRATALRLAGAHGPAALRAEPGGESAFRAWDRRRAALTAYRKQLEPDGEPLHVLRSLLHMHHVRAIGVDPERERVGCRHARAAALRWAADAARPGL